jgi:hypothetical protein
VLGQLTSSGLYQESLNGYNHDNAILLVILVMWCLTRLVSGANLAQRLTGLALIGFPIFGIMISGRRAAFASLAVCLIFFMVILFIRQRKAFLIIATLMLLIVPPYMVAFRNASGPLGLAARAFNSDSAPVGTRDYSSDLYRLIEKTNVRLTIRESPLTGKGFGQEFTRYIQLVNLDAFTYQYFTPHVQILWIWLKLGLFGWVTFWLLICSGLFRLGQIVKYERDIQRLNLAVTAGSIITAIMVFAYLDLSLIDTRLMTLLGISIGLLDIGYRFLRQPGPVKELPALPGTIERELVTAN